MTVETSAASARPIRSGAGARRRRSRRWVWLAWWRRTRRCSRTVGAEAAQGTGTIDSR
jgi:hypothetical protein